MRDEEGIIKAGIIKTPSGRFIFAGLVSFDLLYVSADGSPITSEIVKDQMMLPFKFRSIKSRSFASIAEAQAAEKEIILSLRYPEEGSKNEVPDEAKVIRSF